ncbi:hypothetical protein E0W68_02190 [Flavobacterium salilacus subsp. salilacus]|uniref:hypothetical protein n=1 Tax=Flavobacterium TaxID=237 RepID=UPI0010754A46|nr:MULTISPECIES: hypothetical protein [Flavobacterium]KAF2520052.1 hypothetical protein E0W68_02190 [Flavobacterium salilacus subsp. salilacus]MBE1614032.1 hypothetical protein [Flavobacterium sp. SaA2.13]
MRKIILSLSLALMSLYGCSNDDSATLTENNNIPSEEIVDTVQQPIDYKMWLDSSINRDDLLVRKKTGNESWIEINRNQLSRYTIKNNDSIWITANVTVQGNNYVRGYVHNRAHYLQGELNNYTFYYSVGNNRLEFKKKLEFEEVENPPKWNEDGTPIFE